MAEADTWRGFYGNSGVAAASDLLDFSQALTALKEGHTVRLSTWLETEGLVLVEGLLLYKVSRARVHSVPVGLILATDWKVVGK